MNPKLSMELGDTTRFFSQQQAGRTGARLRGFGRSRDQHSRLAISDTVDHAVVRMVVSNPTRALMLLGERGVLAVENDILMIESDNEPGTLARIAHRLGDASINIEYAYLATSPKSTKGLLILRPSGVGKAHRVLAGL